MRTADNAVMEYEFTAKQESPIVRQSSLHRHLSAMISHAGVPTGLQGSDVTGDKILAHPILAKLVELADVRASTSNACVHLCVKANSVSLRGAMSVMVILVLTVDPVERVRMAPVSSASADLVIVATSVRQRRIPADRILVSTVVYVSA